MLGRTFRTPTGLVPGSVDGWELEAPTLEALAEHAPSRPVEPEGLGESAALVEEEVEVAVDGVESESADGVCEGVDGDAHVDGLDGHEDTDGRRERQHAESARTRRTRVSSCESTPTSIVKSRTRTR